MPEVPKTELENGDAVEFEQESLSILYRMADMLAKDRILFGIILSIGAISFSTIQIAVELEKGELASLTRIAVFNNIISISAAVLSIFLCICVQRFKHYESAVDRANSVLEQESRLGQINRKSRIMNTVVDKDPVTGEWRVQDFN